MLEIDPNPIYTALTQEKGVTPVPEQQDKQSAEKAVPAGK